jgi:hypothetical protein
MAVTTGMVGHGFYDRNSAPQWAAIEAVARARGRHRGADNDRGRRLRLLRRQQLDPCHATPGARDPRTHIPAGPDHPQRSADQRLRRAPARPARRRAIGLRRRRLLGRGRRLDVRAAAAAGLDSLGHELQRDRLPQPAAARALARLHPAQRERPARRGRGQHCRPSGVRGASAGRCRELLAGARRGAGAGWQAAD